MPSEGDSTFRASGVKLVKVSQDVPAGTSINARRLRRYHRKPADVASRAQMLASVMSESVDASSQLMTWSQTALEAPYVATASEPFTGAPDLVVSYMPHADSLSVTRKFPGPDPDGMKLVRTKAEDRAKATLTSLADAGLVDGTFVLGRSGANTVSIRGRVPYNRTYIFEYFRVVDGFIVNNASVEIQVGRDYEVERLKVRDVEVLEVVDRATIHRSVTQVQNEMRALIGAELQTVRPGLVADLATPLASYHLDALEDEQSVFPRVLMRWSAIGDNGTTSRGRVSALDFREGAVMEHVYPLEQPIFCRDFRVGDRIALNEGEYIMDEDYALSFVDLRDPIGRCEHGHIYPIEQGGGTSFELRNVQPSDALYKLGLRSGDRNLKVCDGDPDSQSFDQCVSLTDFASFAQAFGLMSASGRFRLYAEREGVDVQSVVRIEQCPVLGGVADCRAS